MVALKRVLGKKVVEGGRGETGAVLAIEGGRERV